MKISTRGRYALRVLVDLAGGEKDRYVSLSEIAERQEISRKYLEGIMADLAASGAVDGRHGKGGGYRLAVDPAKMTVGDALRAAEGDLAPVACLEKDCTPCPRRAKCKTVGMWRKLQETIDAFFDGITIADLAAAPTAE